MRKMLAVAVVLGLAALPVMAGVGTVTPVSQSTLTAGQTFNAATGQLSQTAPSPRFAGTIYADVGVAGVLNAGTTASYPLPVGDDIHAIAGGTMTSFTFGYFMPSTASGPTGQVTFRFYTTDISLTAVPPSPPSGAFYTTTVTVAGLPNSASGGVYVSAVAVTGLSVPVGTDFWIEQDWSGNGVPVGGPIITGDSSGAVGFSYSVFSQTGSLWTLTNSWADFFYVVNVVPEPATIGLLAFGGLVILRRRK